MKSNRTVVGVDTAKRVFQLHWVDVETGEIVVMKLTRRKFPRALRQSPVLRCCDGGVRRFAALGSTTEPWLLPARAVRPFLTGNKNDVHDARAIWTAAQQPGAKMVAIKSEEQQAVLAMHRMRQQLVKFPYRPDQRPARPADRIRGGYAAKPGWHKPGDSCGLGASGRTAAGDGRGDPARAVGARHPA